MRLVPASTGFGADRCARRPLYRQQCRNISRCWPLRLPTNGHLLPAVPIGYVFPLQRRLRMRMRMRRRVCTEPDIGVDRA